MPERRPIDPSSNDPCDPAGMFWGLLAAFITLVVLVVALNLAGIDTF